MEFFGEDVSPERGAAGNLPDLAGPGSHLDGLEEALESVEATGDVCGGRSVLDVQCGVVDEDMNCVAPQLLT